MNPVGNRVDFEESVEVMNCPAVADGVGHIGGDDPGAGRCGPDTANLSALPVHADLSYPGVAGWDRPEGARSGGSGHGEIDPPVVACGAEGEVVCETDALRDGRKVEAAVDAQNVFGGDDPLYAGDRGEEGAAGDVSGGIDSFHRGFHPVVHLHLSFRPLSHPFDHGGVGDKPCCEQHGVRPAGAGFGPAVVGTFDPFMADDTVERGSLPDIDVFEFFQGKTA